MISLDEDGISPELKASGLKIEKATGEVI